jgi:prepilin-type processing-associated H-X9-DG protein
VWNLSPVRGLPPFSYTGPSGATVTVDYRTVGTSEIYSFHTGGVHVLFVDGSVHFISESIDPNLVAAGVTIDRQEQY